MSAVSASTPRSGIGWREAGPAPVAVVMISLNEAHNLAAVLDNVAGWAREVFLVDSYSADRTVDIALARGVHVVQRSFTGFGDQWNFALRLPIAAPWTMKLDPDERLTPELKAAIINAIAADDCDGIDVRRRLWFMGRPLPVRQTVLRVWRTGACRFSDVTVNEHPLVEGRKRLVAGELEHHDSPNLHHWYEKQNRYTSAEALGAFRGERLAVTPRFLGSALERRMWIKRAYAHVPFRHWLVHLYCLFGLGAWRAGRAGFIWARLRAEVYRMREYKRLEMEWRGSADELPAPHIGRPDPRAPQYEVAALRSEEFQFAEGIVRAPAALTTMPER
jgi:glycosyltransferase involved in cell wall biosynthesis